MGAGQKGAAGGAAGSGKLTTVLVPVIGVAVIVALIVVVAAMSDSPAQPTGQGSGKAGGGAKAELLLKADAKTLSDGTEPGAEDPGLKDVGGGLKIRDIKEGEGAAVPHGATVEVYYTGWLTNGKVFDSSAQRGETIEFSLNQVVRGWQEGIPGMKVGGVRKLVVPPELGYGSQNKGTIPPNSTLVFEVQLVGVR